MTDNIEVNTITFKRLVLSNLTLADLSRADIAALMDDKYITPAVFAAVQNEFIKRITKESPTTDGFSPPEKRFT